MITASPVSPSDVGTTVCPACRDVVVAEPYHCTVVVNRNMGLALLEYQWARLVGR
jgi:hypothetical protein